MSGRTPARCCRSATRGHVHDEVGPTAPTPCAAIDLDIGASELVAVVGESGSGKSVTMLAVLGLLDANATVTGSVRFDGVELVGAPPLDPAGDPWAAHRHRVPGSHDVAQPRLHGRPPARRGRARPSPAGQAAGRGPCRRTPRAGVDQRRGEAAQGLPARALRRAAPAGDDRDGAGQRSRPAHRRRADHRPRRHDPGPDPRRAAGDPATSAISPSCWSPTTSASSPGWPIGST